MSSNAAIRMPQLGLTMTEGTLVEWLSRPGERITAGQVLFVVETDKIANEVLADRDGSLGEIVVAAGDTVPVGAVLAYWSGAQASAVETAAGAATVARAVAPAASPRVEAGDDAAPTTSRPRATPHARKLARIHGVDLGTLAGTGPRARIKACDVLAAAASGPVAGAPDGAPPIAMPVTHSAAQKTVAARMAQAKRDIPHFYLDAEADIGALLDLHREVKARPAYGGLTLTHWIALALGLTLAADARFRCVQIGDEVLEHAGADIGIATATDKGLYVPVARGLERKSLAIVTREMNDLVARARAGRLTAGDSTGGIGCVSNLGQSHIRHVFPIIIPGHASILGVGRLNELFRPDATGAPALKREIGLVLSCDHRVLNGADGARILDGVLARLADPLSLLLHAA